MGHHHVDEQLPCGCQVCINDIGVSYLVQCPLHKAAPDLLAVCVKMTNDGRFYKFNRDRGKYTCLACGGSGDSPRSIQHEKWCIINEAINAIAKAKGDQC